MVQVIVIREQGQRQKGQDQRPTDTRMAGGLSVVCVGHLSLRCVVSEYIKDAEAVRPHVTLLVTPESIRTAAIPSDTNHGWPDSAGVISPVYTSRLISRPAKNILPRTPSLRGAQRGNLPGAAPTSEYCRATLARQIIKHKAHRAVLNAGAGKSVRVTSVSGAETMRAALMIFIFSGDSFSNALMRAPSSC